MRHKAAAAAALAVLIVTGVACTSGDSTTDPRRARRPPVAADDRGADRSVARASPTTPSRSGITYVDLDAVRQFVDLDQGDYEAAYQAVIDDINADGGINGRKIEPVFAKVSPLGTEPAEAVCTEADRGRGRVRRHRVLPGRCGAVPDRCARDRRHRRRDDPGALRPGGGTVVHDRVGRGLRRRRGRGDGRSRSARRQARRVRVDPLRGAAPCDRGRSSTSSASSRSTRPCSTPRRTTSRRRTRPPA